MKNVIPPLLRVNETVIYSPAGGQPKEVASHSDASFVRVLSNDEQPYRRTFEVGEEWKPLDFGWAGPSPSQIVVMNEEGQFRGGIPTEERKAEVLAKVVEIGIKVETYQGNEDFIQTDRIRPLQSIRTEPIGEKYIRCVKGRAKVTIAAVPGDGA